jgi:hypothetical protein
VSRVGIEPTTRRLRVTGWMSAGVQRVVLLNDLLRRRPAMSAVSTDVRRIGFHLGFQRFGPFTVFHRRLPSVPNTTSFSLAAR